METKLELKKEDCKKILDLIKHMESQNMNNCYLVENRDFIEELKRHLNKI